MIIFFNYTLMKKSLIIIFSVLLSTSLYAQIGPDGTGIVNGYFIGPGVDLTFADLSYTNLSNANLSGAILMGTDLSGANLRGAILSNADLLDTILISADLSRADLSYANLSGAILYNVNLSGANLSGADLSYALLQNADFFGTIWSNVISPSDYNAVVAERDARPTQAAYAAVVTERDAALAAQATAEAERDSRPTQASYDAVVADRNVAVVENDFVLEALAIAVAERDAAVSDRDAAVVERDSAVLEGAEALATAEAERDARPTQAAYDALVVERDAKLTLDEVKDLRAGSKMIEVHNGQATLSMEVEQSDDLDIWTNGGASTLQIPIDAEAGKKFFRFKMAE